MVMTLSSVVFSSEMGGKVKVSGLATGAALYATGGETMDLSAYFLSGGTPIIVCSGDDGYVAQSDRGTSAANKVVFFEAGADAAALDEVAVNTNMAAVIITFTATGPTT